MNNKILIIENDIKLSQNLISVLNEDGYTINTVEPNNKISDEQYIILTIKVEREFLNKNLMKDIDGLLTKQFTPYNNTDSIRHSNGGPIITYPHASNIQNDKIKPYSLDDKIIVGNHNNFRFELIKNLKYITTERPYVYLKFANGKSVLMRDTISNWETKLPGNTFIRIRRATIINIDFILRIDKRPTSYLVQLKDETKTFTISKRYSSKIKNRFSNKAFPSRLFSYL